MLCSGGGGGRGSYSEGQRMRGGSAAGAVAARLRIVAIHLPRAIGGEWWNGVSGVEMVCGGGASPNDRHSLTAGSRRWEVARGDVSGGME